MAHTKLTARKILPNPFPRRRLATMAARKNASSDIPSTSSDSELESKYESESEKEEDSEAEMPQHEENGGDNPAQVDRNGANAREVSREKYDQALKDRDMALKELSNLRAELKLEKKVWEAEKKTLNERLDKEVINFATELKTVQKSLSKCEAELERTSQERDSYRNSLELGNKAWEDGKKTLAAALNMEFIKFGTKLKGVLRMESMEKENAMELGKKVSEAENIDMANRKRKMLIFN